jgi:hypothetical protein
MPVVLGDWAEHYSPDVLQFIVPGTHQLVGIPLYPSYDVVTYDYARASLIPGLSDGPGRYGSGIETAVGNPITAIALIVFAGYSRAQEWRRASRVWLLFGVIFALLAAGPWLRIAGTSTVPMPYALLSLLPGFNVMRTPGRFMMVGSAGFALAAACGFAALIARWPRRARLVTAVTIALIAIECWPRPWTMRALPPVPAFYDTLARDPEHFAVVDLPSGRWSTYAASAYMYYQVVHRKPMLWGYLSRHYTTFPISGLAGILVDTAPDAMATRERLAGLGYRYLVWHKRAEGLFSDAGARGEPVDAHTNAFVKAAFAGEKPILDDDLVTVYRLDARSAPVSDK